MRAGPYGDLARMVGITRAQLSKLLAVSEGTLRRWDRGLDAADGQHSLAAILSDVLSSKASDPFTAVVTRALVLRALQDSNPPKFLFERMIIATTVAERQGRV